MLQLTIAFTIRHSCHTGRGCCKYWDLHLFTSGLSLLAMHVSDCLELYFVSLWLSLPSLSCPSWSLILVASCCCRQVDICYWCPVNGVLHVRRSELMPVSISLLGHLILIGERLEMFLCYPWPFELVGIYIHRGLLHFELAINGDMIHMSSHPWVSLIPLFSQVMSSVKIMDYIVLIGLLLTTFHV